MASYRRAFIPGGTWSFKVNLLERHRNDWVVREIDRLRETVRRVWVRNPFHINAWAVLPDHLHCIWMLPPNDSDFSTQWRLIESSFSLGLPKTERLSDAGEAAGERGTGNGVNGNT
ncbi:REP-associated tyrosine transposase [Methylotetracoccus oryzae]|uniref:REP-associated tyrosine transposase n=1 Tax=Methylotetracoccus oryzae TaxID=1919059 RepID=UPI001912DC3E|nr:transposase [Methylotetracoccus oryzae]